MSAEAAASPGETREYSVVEQVPMDARHYGWLDMFLTWIGANANTGSWFIGGLAASVGLGSAFAIVMLSNPLAYLIVAAIGYMGFKVGTTTMSLTRASLGIRGSKVASWLNLLQYVGWTVVGTYIGAISLSFIFAEWFGMAPFGEKGSEVTMTIGILLISILSGAIVIVGGNRSIKVAERVGVLALIALGVWATVAVLGSWDLAAIGNWKAPEGAALPQGVVVDIFAIYGVTWFPAIAEFTRFTKDRQAATTAPFIGALVAILWFGMIGVLATIAGSLQAGSFDPVFSDPSSVLSQLGLGWVAFLVLILATLSTNVIDLYVAGYSIVNLQPRISIVKSFVIVSVLATVVAFLPMFLTLIGYIEGFLNLIGAIFGPIAAIMIVDFFVLRGQRYDWSQADKVGGAYWYGGGFHLAGIVAWVVGAVAYTLLMGLGVPDVFQIAPVFPIFMDSIGGFYPAMAVSAIAYYALAKGLGSAKATAA